MPVVHFNLQEEVILVQLEKDSRGLGITLATGTLSSSDESFVFIRHILEGGVAEQNGQLKVGDRIVSVS